VKKKSRAAGRRRPATSPALAALITQAQNVRDDAWASILAGLGKIDRVTLDLDEVLASGAVPLDVVDAHPGRRSC